VSFSGGGGEVVEPVELVGAEFDAFDMT